jgi:hypothetical protein
VGVEPKLTTALACVKFVANDPLDRREVIQYALGQSGNYWVGL